MDQNNTGPTVLDFNGPRTYGITPSARQVITPSQPVVSDPMFTPQEASFPSSSKINVKVDESPYSPPAIANEQQSSPFLKPVSDTSAINQNQMFNTDRPVLTKKFDESTFIDSNRNSIGGGDNPKPSKSHKKLWLLVLGVLIVLAGVYAAIDKGLILDSVNLPVHIFKQSSAATSSASISSTSAPSVPSGFTATKLIEANLNFAYPATWGAPTAATDQGFSKRSTSATADVSYAYILNFPNNKEVQLSITSGKFLPPSRAVQYYDYLSWCIGTADAKYYAGVLRFATTSGVDSPTTITCDQGPLNNAAKLTSDTIVQTNVKNTDNSLLGDIYTRNLTNNDYVVAHAIDTTSKNADQIKTMLASIQNIQ